MIALAGLAKIKRRGKPSLDGGALAFSVHPRWSLAEATTS
jgi:hypothetical protein